MDTDRKCHTLKIHIKSSQNKQHKNKLYGSQFAEAKYPVNTGNNTLFHKKAKKSFQLEATLFSQQLILVFLNSQPYTDMHKHKYAHLCTDAGTQQPHTYCTVTLHISPDKICERKMIIFNTTDEALNCQKIQNHHITSSICTKIC